MNYVSLTRSVAGVVLLSPGLNYGGLSTDKAVTHLNKTAALLVASPADPYAYQSCQRLVQLNPTLVFWSDVKAGHGVQMFDEKLLGRIFNWMEKQ
jgi:hypothetical protein